MSERVERREVRTWAYQHDFDGRRDFRGNSSKIQTLPSENNWHQETLARLLGYCAIRFKQPAYLDAWAESRSAAQHIDGDHETSAALQFLPWIQSKLWQGTLDDQGKVCVHAVHFGPRTPNEAKILTPHGEVSLMWRTDQSVAAPETMDVSVHSWL